MRPDNIVAVAQHVADGSPVDWSSEEFSTASAERIEVLRNLRVISSLGTVHRTDPGVERVAKSAVGDTVLQTLPTWGQFALLQRLGAGSQGEVYHAIDLKLEREVAIKFLRKPAQSNVAANVLGEARLLARVRHPNVATVYGADLIGDRVGLWMELISGVTLHALIQSRGPMNALEASLSVWICVAPWAPCSRANRCCRR